MSRLLDSQIAFAGQVSNLINKAFELGYHVTLGDAYRDPRCPYGSRSSRHKSRLAIDLNLFLPRHIDEATYQAFPARHRKRYVKRQLASGYAFVGKKRKQYLRGTDDHRVLGEWWERQGGIWGGSFASPDGNHYEWPLKLDHGGL